MAGTVEETDLSRVPMELNSAVGCEIGCQQGPVGFQDGDRAATIVIGAFEGHKSDTQTWTCMEGNSPGAGRNGHMLVLVDRVSVVKI
jgi:hypothetical protein